MRPGRHFRIPEGPQDLCTLWAEAARLDPVGLPAWLDADEAGEFRLVGGVSLAGLSPADRAAADDECGELELARLVVDEDVADPDVRRVYVRRPRPEPVWSIGIAAAAAPWAAWNPLPTSPVLAAGDVTDVSATSLADPFLLRRDGRWFMFFEVENWRTWKGEIGLATSVDGLDWRYERIVLVEDFHLSYPCVFETDEGVYMIPESSQAESVRLYRARRFPFEWEHVADLLRGRPFADPSILHHAGRWWLFAETSGGQDDTLRLYHADVLAGPWQEHPLSPLVTGDPENARPAGRVLAVEGRLFRMSQNCRPAYGTDVRVHEITRLTPHDYEERPLPGAPVLGPAATGWNSGGMHHVDPVQMADGRWLAAVDGWCVGEATDAPARSDAHASDRDLLTALRPLLAADGVGAGIAFVSRRANEYVSSSRSEVVSLRLPSGDLREVFVKYRRDVEDPPPRCRQGIGYCFDVYRHVVSRTPLTHLEPLGLITVGPSATQALVVEYLADCLRVGETPDESGILSAAAWCGAFHRWAESACQREELSFLVRYDAGYYDDWAARAARIAARVGEEPPWLAAVCTAFRKLVPALVAAPQTVIHGECSPQNVLWKEGAIYPVDWESAAIGPGEIDLAALLFGWPSQTVERCVAAYWRARGGPPPQGSAEVWAAATLYTALRWLPEAASPADAAAFRKGWDAVEQAAVGLGVI